jgi:hypothetical protein
MLAEGVYRGRAKSWDLGETSTGKEQVAVEFQFTSDGFTTERRTWYGYFTDKTLDRTIESLRAMGWTGTDLSNLEGLDANEVELVVGHEPEVDENGNPTGQVRERIRWVNAIGGGLGLRAPLNEAKKKEFAARMKGAIVAFDQRGGRRQASSAAPQPQRAAANGSGRGGVMPPEPPPITDDIPF